MAQAPDLGHAHPLGPHVGTASGQLPSPRALGAQVATGDRQAFPVPGSPALETKVVLIDSQLADSGQLIADVAPGSKIFVYNSQTDSANQVLQRVVAWADAAGSQIQDLAILSHGVGGAFELGNQWISATTLPQTVADWQRLSSVLSPGAAIEIFGCDVAAPGSHGQSLLNALAAATRAAVFALTDTTGAGGNWQLEAASAGASPAALALSAVPLNTSLLAAYPAVLGGTTITVTTSADTLDGDSSSIASLLAAVLLGNPVSLRDAITAVDNTASAAPATIDFDIPGSGTHTINISSALPTITSSVIIDGTSQPGYAGTPLIQLQGTSNPYNGLDISANNVTVEGLSIYGFSAGNGIQITSASGTVIQANYVGLTAAGTAAANGTGIVLSGASNNIVGGTAAADRNVISGNAGNGIFISSGNNNLIEGNYIGTNVSGTVAVANADEGIEIACGTGNTIGGSTTGAGNVISGNGQLGVWLYRQRQPRPPAAISSRAISSAPTPRAWRYWGTGTAASNSPTPTQTRSVERRPPRGTSSPATRDDGVTIQSSSNNNLIEGNYIGTAADGVNPAGQYHGGRVDQRFLEQYHRRHDARCRKHHRQYDGRQRRHRRRRQHAGRHRGQFDLWRQRPGHRPEQRWCHAQQSDQPSLGAQ